MTRSTKDRPVVEQWDAGYPRVSTDMQVERDALQNQVQALEAHALAHGLNLRLYKEEGVSAKDTDRPSLQALIRDVRAGHVRSVVVTKLDRVSRSLSDLLDLMNLFEEHGVKFVSLRDNIDTSGPVGRFMLHILGAIAELERAITAERVAEDMKLRAKRGTWNGGLAPYGRRIEDGQLRIVPEEAAVLHRMRQLLLEHRTWRGVAIALNRAGLRTRGWEAVERDGHLVREGHEPAEWTPWAVKRVLLQRINEGTRVYNRRSTRGRKIVPRPEEEHVVVPNYCEPIFSHEEMDELLRVAAEIEGTPPRAAASTHLLSGLVYCTCGIKMYGVNGYVNSKRGRYKVVYYRCRQGSHSGTCSAKQIPAHVVEPVLVEALQKLSLDRSQLEPVTQEARTAFEAAYRPLCEQREEASKDLDRERAELASLLELAEDRLITKEEYASRKARLEGDRDALDARMAAVDAELAARADTTVDIDAVVAGLRCLSDVYDELEDVADRRRLLAHCVSKVVVKPSELDLHLPAYPVLIRPDASADGGTADTESDRPKVPSQVHSSPAGGPRDGRGGPEKWADSPGHAQSASSNRVGVRGRMGAHACANAQVDGEAGRESKQGQGVVLVVPLPRDVGQAGDGRPRVHRYRSLDLRLGRELLAFRARYGLTQDEVARVVAVSRSPTISQWEAGRSVQDGVRRERLREHLDGRLWLAGVLPNALARSRALVSARIPRSPRSCSVGRTGQSAT